MDLVHALRRGWMRYAGAVVLIACCVIALLIVSDVNSGAAAPVLLLGVLVVARAWGTGPALLASATASAAFSYYFLPPIGFAIQDPNDWVAFVTFTITAIIVGELAARAERRHLEAQEGRREIERLYVELEAAFDRASEAEAARRHEQLKAALLDALTHNLRTPLTAIKAAVTALIAADGSKEQAPLSREGHVDLLQVIDQESDRLNRFIEGLSGIGTRQAPAANLTPAALEPAIRGALGRAQALVRDYRVIVAVEDGLPRVSVDAAAVTEVVYILLDNASKYAPWGSTIQVAAGRLDDACVRVTVMDEGPGIPTAYRERVFENFFQVPGMEPRDPRRGGIGLGLSIARRLVETQAGRMWIETPPSGRGTIVAFTLTSAAEAPATERSTAAAASN